MTEGQELQQKAQEMLNARPLTETLAELEHNIMVGALALLEKRKAEFSHLPDVEQATIISVLLNSYYDEWIKHLQDQRDSLQVVLIEATAS